MAYKNTGPDGMTSLMSARCLLRGVAFFYCLAIGGTAAAQPSPTFPPRGSTKPSKTLTPQRFGPLPRVPTKDPLSYRRLATQASQVVDRVLQSNKDGSTRMARQRRRARQFWTVVPVDTDIVRIQQVRSGILRSLTAQRHRGEVTVEPSLHDPKQLWRVVSRGPSVRLASIAFPGKFLAGADNGHVRLKRRERNPSQWWLIDLRPPPVNIVLPSLRLDLRQVQPNQPLSPVDVWLVNSHRQNVTLVIADLRTNQPNLQLTLRPGQRVPFTFHRDAGSTLTETYESISPTGLVTVDRFITPIAPAILYDVSVYERFLQSIAIDRTGTSPKQIEDVNFQLQSVGLFPLPAGEDLRPGTVIDVWEKARAARNPGGVRRLKPKESDPETGPLERLLEELTPSGK